MLEPLRLLTLADFLDSIDEARVGIRRMSGSFGSLEAVTANASSFKRETAQVREKIDASGEVVDHASPELKADSRPSSQTAHQTSRDARSYLRGKETSKYLQEQVVTERNGRYVLVVKTEHRNAIPGIVHGTSTSGASLFLEPLSTVEINNDIVALEEQEREEIRRILLALTECVSFPASLDLHRTVEAGTELDVFQARARFAMDVDGIEPQLSTNGAFELQSGRHPLLMPQVIGLLDRARVRSDNPAPGPVPVTIKVQPPATCLLITGPNTGGKTVALKTAGLLAMMAQAGLHIPAAEGFEAPGVSHGLRGHRRRTVY